MECEQRINRGEVEDFDFQISLLVELLFQMLGFFGLVLLDRLRERGLVMNLVVLALLDIRKQLLVFNFERELYHVAAFIRDQRLQVRNGDRYCRDRLLLALLSEPPFVLRKQNAQLKLVEVVVDRQEELLMNLDSLIYSCSRSGFRLCTARS